MPTSRLVTGTHTFTFPYRIDGWLAAEFECSCTYTIYRGRPAIHSPPPGEPAEPDEIREITDIQVEVTEIIPGMQFDGYVAGIPRLSSRRVDPDPALKEKIEHYLLHEGAEALLEAAAEAGEAA